MDARYGRAHPGVLECASAAPRGHGRGVRAGAGGGCAAGFGAGTACAGLHGAELFRHHAAPAAAVVSAAAAGFACAAAVRGHAGAVAAGGHVGRRQLSRLGIFAGAGCAGGAVALVVLAAAGAAAARTGFRPQSAFVMATVLNLVPATGSIFIYASLR